MNASQLIAHLNAMSCGDLASVSRKLDAAAEACRQMDEAELVAMLTEARGCLDRGDLKTYRRRLQTVVARLGHLRSRTSTAAG